MQLHSNATTCPKQRQLIRNSSLSLRVLARNLGVSVSTVHHWKHQTSPYDRSCRPHTIRCVLEGTEEALVLHLRHTAALSLDDLFDLLQPLLPHLRRSSLHRLLVRHGCNRLPKPDPAPTGQFKTYGPGYLHIDCFHLPRLDGKKSYCYVAIDRATRLLYLRVYPQRNSEAALDFLHRCLEFFPFTIDKILTDNGREFTLATFRNRYGAAKKLSPFTQLCQRKAIEHRLIRPYKPQTNGMVERANGLIKQGTVKINSYGDANEMKADLLRYFVFYNFERPHRQIGRLTPYEAVCKWHYKQPELFHKQPAELLAYRSQTYGT